MKPASFRLAYQSVILFSFAMLCVALETCTAQTVNFEYKAVPVRYLPSAKKIAYLRTQAYTIANTSFNLSQCLPPNFVKDGSVDYTAYIQKGINDHNDVVFPDFPLLVNKSGLSLKSNTKVIFTKHSSLVLVPTDQGSYAILKLYNIKNVDVYFPVIIGDRKTHQGTSGEWGMGISIRSSNNIQIYNPKVSECWGDGIYIADDGKVISENIALYYAQLDFNRRNGISIISAKNLKVINAVVSNTSGAMPMAGIDIEPDTSENVAEGILIQNPVTFNNSSSGIQIGLSKFPGRLQKMVDINIVNHIDDQSSTGFYLGGFYTNYKDRIPLKGLIQITNSKWINNSVPFRGNDHYEFSPTVNITNSSILKNDKNRIIKVDKDQMSLMKKNFSDKKNIIIQ